MYQNGIQDEYIADAGVSEWHPFDAYGFTSPWAPRLWKASLSANCLYASILSFTAVVFFFFLFPPCRSWCLIPLFICGVVSGKDIIAWLRKEVDTFDVKAMLGGILFLNTFLAPLLHLAFDVYGKRLHTPDPTKYFGYMAIYNSIGLCLYNVSQHFFFKSSRPVRTIWRLNSGKFLMILVPVLGISLAAMTVIHLFFGGLVESMNTIYVSSEAQAHMGKLSVVLMLADPAPLLVMMAVVFWLRTKKQGRMVGIGFVLVLLIGCAVLQFMLVGLRSSRTAILSVLIIELLFIHYSLRPINIKIVIMGLCLVFMFSYLYDFYKKMGDRGLEAFYSTEARESLSYEYEGGGTFLTTLLGDYARADVQAFMMYRLIESGNEFRPIYGQSYGMAALAFVPRAIWRNKPKNPKVEAGSEILQYVGLSESSRQYGLAGEAMLNFKQYAILPAFLIFGGLIGWFRKKVATLEPLDSRFFLVPVLTMLLTLAINIDFGNVTFNLLKLITLPLIVVFLGSTQSRFQIV